jgi:eukaryotic-like serine/threonine-protein kinase
MAKQLAAFVENVRSSGLLRPELIEQIAAWAAPDDADAQAIAKEIVKQGWLTAFQVKMFWKGRGAELLLSQYVLTDRLGEGGMGEVFRAKHRRMDRDVALKIIRRERLANPDAIRRFNREVQAAAKLVHENIVLAYDADQVGDRHFFAMEFVDGANLARLVKEKGPFPIDQACDCIRQAALGLQHAFECGMVHRDIKPSNLFLSKKGVLKILDMGLARVLDPAEGEFESRITQEGLVVGTPDYLAPEQARDSRNTDIRADIYSLGCTFYYLLCGHTPFQGGTPTEKMLKHTTEPVPSLTRPDVPPKLAAIVYRMLAKTPEERYERPNEVAFALQPFAAPMLVPSGILRRPDTAAPAGAEQLLAWPDGAAPIPQPAAQPLRQPRSDSQFRLPSDSGEGPEPEKPRGNGLLIACMLVVLCLLGGSIYLLLRG